MPAPISRHMILLGHRQVHYRRAGSGPAVLLLHGSPNSSAAMVGMMNVLSERFTVIAPDTPGNGLSEPLTGDPEVADYARAPKELVDGLKLGRFGLYGFHTGAAIAASFAAQFPGQVAMAVLDGLLVFNPGEREDFLAHYLPPFAPQWDGGHLTWAWARFQEQQIFFPWHAKDLAHRMDYAVAAPANLHAGVMDLLTAGDHYRKPYRAAFRADGPALALALPGPAIIASWALDPLYPHLDRLPPLPPHVRIERMGPDFAANWGPIGNFLAEHLGDVAPPAPPQPGFHPDRITHAFYGPPGQQLLVAQGGGGSGRPVMALHDPAGSSRLAATFAEGFRPHRPVLMPDLPGNGESADILGPEARAGMRAPAEAMLALMDQMGVQEADVVGRYSGGLVGAEMALQAPGRIKHLAILGVPVFSPAERDDLLAHYTPSIAPSWEGAHLIRAWQMMRFQALFWPWYRMTREGVIWRAPQIDPELIHLRTVELLKCGDRYRENYAAMFTYPALERLPQLKVPTLLAGPAWEPIAPKMAEAAGALPHMATLELPDAFSDWAEALLPFLDR